VVAQLVEKYPVFYRILNVIGVFTRVYPPLDPVLGEISPIHIFTSYSFAIDIQGYVADDQVYDKL
jgi:hypothetical protein